MRSDITTLHYNALRESLARAGAVVALAELHGGVCGALSAGGVAAAQRWLEDCFDDQQYAVTAEVATALQEIVASSWQALEQANLEFEPLLPDDDAPLAEQVQALALWCHGFLGGLGASAPDVDGRAAGDGPSSPAPVVAEIIGDFSEISRAALSDDEAQGKDDPEFALAELHEYVRASVQIVFEELAGRRTAARDFH